MTSTTSNVAFGNAYSSVQANNIHGSVYISTGMLRDRLTAAELSRRSGALSRPLKQDLTTPSIVSRALKMRPLTRSQSSTSLSACLTRALPSLTRYTTGRTAKMSGASSG